PPLRGLVRPAPGRRRRPGARARRDRGRPPRRCPRRDQPDRPAGARRDRRARRLPRSLRAGRALGGARRARDRERGAAPRGARVPRELAVLHDVSGVGAGSGRGGRDDRGAGLASPNRRRHGLPTRSLDWTRDPYVAAYFAAPCGARVGVTWLSGCFWNTSTTSSGSSSEGSVSSGVGSGTLSIVDHALSLAPERAHVGRDDNRHHASEGPDHRERDAVLGQILASIVGHEAGEDSSHFFFLQQSPTATGSPPAEQPLCLLLGRNPWGAAMQPRTISHPRHG